jgi:hypothetical protein
MTALQRAHALAAAQVAAAIEADSENVIRDVLASRIGVRPTDRRVDLALDQAHELGLLDFKVTVSGRVRIAVDEDALAALEGAAA